MVCRKLINCTYIALSATMILIAYDSSADEPISTLSWLPQDTHMLALGNLQGWVKVYDTRAPDRESPALSIAAHIANRAKRIRGIRCDPRNSNAMATFSDYAGEPVKVWDLRMVASANTKLATQCTVVPYYNHELQYVSQSSTIEVVWSRMQENVVAIGTTASKSISLYDVSTPMAGAV